MRGTIRGFGGVETEGAWGLRGDAERLNGCKITLSECMTPMKLT